MHLNKLLEEKKAVIDDALRFFLPDETDYPPTIHRALHYSVFAGGKRIRPILALQTAELFSPNWRRIIPPACALELIHTYSLIHDDLPAMDNDDYRRGRLTSHKVFGEGMAILAGDALLTLAFEILAGTKDKYGEYESDYWSNVSPEVKLNVNFEIAVAAGTKGMIGGQVVDLKSEGKSITKETLEYIEEHKTGALITASVRLGALLSGANNRDLHRLTLYARLLGNAFQIVDDLLDIEGNEEKMGKAKGADARNQKPTYVSLYGLEGAKKRREELYKLALKELDDFGDKADVLRELTRFILYRNY
ncbi:MAG TPA: polyprenyl synthetase family protein [Firmicutes bacterium]|jgi:geranylgeranyl diphosphate synthase type II|nr:polyprenyl synthetase family protein [Bacillota bacterium]